MGSDVWLSHSDPWGGPQKHEFVESICELVFVAPLCDPQGRRRVLNSAPCVFIIFQSMFQIGTFENAAASCADHVHTT